MNICVAGNDRFECLANNFKVTDDRGTVLFSADHHEVVVGADILRVTGEGGTMFTGSVQTPLVRAESGHGLRFVNFYDISSVLQLIIGTTSVGRSRSCILISGGFLWILWWSAAELDARTRPLSRKRNLFHLLNLLPSVYDLTRPFLWKLCECRFPIKTL